MAIDHLECASKSGGHLLLDEVVISTSNRFSTTGFEWTYSGNEPRQLALALLANYLGDDTRALELSEGFMNAVVSDLDNDWQLTGNEIAAALEALG